MAQASLPAPFGTGPPLAMTDAAAAAGMYRCPAPGSHGSLAAFASPASAAISARAAPAVGVCPITQEVMQNPVLAADGALRLSLAPGPAHAGHMCMMHKGMRHHHFLCRGAVMWSSCARRVVCAKQTRTEELVRD